VFGNRANQLAWKILGMRGREAHPLDAGDVRHPPNEVGEPNLAVPVGIDVLAQQRDLPVSLARQRPGLVHDALGVAAPFTPARERHHAEGAHVVAPAHHRQPGVYARAAHGVDAGIRLRTGELQVGDGAAAVSRRRNRVRQTPIAVRPGDEVDVVVAVEQVVFEILRHAPQDADCQLPAGPQRLLAPELLEAPENPQVRPLANRARVQQYDVGVGHLTGEPVAGPPTDRFHEFGVVLVHLATVRLYIDIEPSGHVYIQLSILQ
jgi:hypothetical protein